MYCWSSLNDAVNSAVALVVIIAVLVVVLVAGKRRQTAGDPPLRLTRILTTAGTPAHLAVSCGFHGANADLVVHEADI